MTLYVCTNCSHQNRLGSDEQCSACHRIGLMVPKKDFWEAQIGKSVDAQNYRGESKSGILNSVRDGLWGYGGDSVALELSVTDSDGESTWPAGKCLVSQDLPSA